MCEHIRNLHSLGWLFLEHASDQVLDLSTQSRQVGASLKTEGCSAGEDLDLGQVLVVEWEAGAQKKVDHHTEAPNIDLEAISLRLDDLRGHVAGCADAELLLAVFSSELDSTAKVSKLDFGLTMG